MVSSCSDLSASGKESPRMSKKRPVPHEFELPPLSKMSSLPPRSLKERIDDKMKQCDKCMEIETRDSSSANHSLDEDSLPEEPMYHDSFAKAEQAFEKISQRMLSKLSMVKDSELELLLKPRLQKTSSITRSDPELVGFLGQTGQGKSTAVGVLLGHEALTIKGGGGESVTRVPIIYSHRQSPTAVPFEARLTVCDQRTGRDMIRKHLGYILSTAENANVNHQTGSQDKNDTSEKFIKDLLLSQPGLSTDEAMHRFLSPGTGNDEIYEKCEEWGEARRKDLIKMVEPGIFAANADELWTKLAEYAGISLNQDAPTLHSYDPSPLIEKIEIFSSSRLRLSLGDFPGLGDVNKDRGTKTLRQLERCKTVVVTEDINRAADSQVLQDVLADQHKRRPAQSIIVVLTRCEKDIDISNRVNTAFDAIQLADLDYLERRGAQVASQLSALPIRAHEQRDRLKFESKYIRLRQVAIFVQERIMRTERKLRFKYERMTGGRLLSIHSISAKAYSEVTQGYSQLDTKPLPLSVHLSGIPALLHKLARIPCERVQSDLLHYAEVTFPELLSYVELCCSHTSVEPASKLNELDVITMDIEKFIRVQLNAFEKHHVKPLIESVRGCIPAWTSTANRLCDRWEGWHFRSYWAFLIRQGEHKLKCVYTTNWNQELLEQVQQKLGPYTEHLTTNTKSFMQKMKSDTMQKFNSSIEQLRGTFGEGLEIHAFNLFGPLYSLNSELIDSFEEILIRAKNDGLGNFFNGGMTDVYRVASEARPTNGETRHHLASQEFKKRLCAANGPYRAILDGIEEAWNISKEKILKKVMGSIKKTMSEIREWYERQGMPQQKSAEDKSKVRDELLVMVKEARQEYDKDISKWLLECGLRPKAQVQSL